MPAAPGFAQEAAVEEDDDAVRTLMSAWLSGAHSERSCLEYATSLSRARPETAAKMLALVVRYRGLGRITGEQYQRLTAHIEQLMAEAERNGTAPPPAQPDELVGFESLETTQDLNNFLSQAEARERPAPRPAPAATHRRDAESSTPRRDADAGAPALGTVIAQRYQLQMPLARGARASVYRALDLSRERLGLAAGEVAIKVSPARSAGQNSAALAREFQAAQRLSHPNIINVYDCNADAQYAYYTMELLEGETLHLVLRRLDQAPPRALALTLIRELAEAMAHAHSRGVVHQDLKPQNVILLRSGGVRVLDFGGATTAPRDGEPWISDTSADALFRPATPAYASCQQLEGRTADARDDIYALSCIAYQLLSGRHPFEQLSALEARSRGLRAARPRALSSAAWRALRRGLAWDRDQRPSSIEDWLADWDLSAADESLPPLEQLLTPALPSRSTNTVLWIVVVVALLLGGALLAQQQGWFQSDTHEAAPLAQGDVEQQPVSSSAAPGSIAPSAPIARGSVAPAAPVAGSGTHGKATVSAAPEATASATSTASPSTPAEEVGASAPQIQFAKSSIIVAAGEPAAHVVVHRSGDTRSDLQFMWWTEDGSAKAGTDYASLGRKIEHFARGEDTVTLYVPVISGTSRHESAQFDVLLSTDTTRDDGPSERASVTLRPND